MIVFYKIFFNIKVSCGGGVLSYGRKKRSADRTETLRIQLPRKPRQLAPLPEDLADKLVYDPDLDQDVIRYDTPLRKQIFVDPGIKVNRFTDPTGGEVANGVGFTNENGGKYFLNEILNLVVKSNFYTSK